MNEEGKYDINLYGKIDPSETSYHSFLSALINVVFSPLDKYYFPTFSNDYKDNIELIRSFTKK